MNFFGLFGWWGLFSWIPPYLSIPVSQGGRGFGVLSTTGLLLTLNLLGMLPGYLCFGPFADKLGRKGAFVLYLTAAGLLVPLYANARGAWTIMVLGIVVAFFGTGFFSGSGLIASELFPTPIRARALGVTYNGARMLSAVSPLDHWMVRAEARPRLSVLSLRPGISAGGGVGSASTGNSRTRARVERFSQLHLDPSYVWRRPHTALNQNPTTY